MRKFPTSAPEGFDVRQTGMPLPLIGLKTYERRRPLGALAFRSPYSEYTGE
jgi:hypothetical protein